MQVFISWSGDQANAVAVGLGEWLPLVLAQKVDCFVSSRDIESGARGMNVIAQELEQSEFGIVIVTPDNLEKPWINFEAGALSKAFADNAQVAPLLVGLAEKDVDGPLAQFQMRLATEKESVLQLVLSVNRAQSEPVGDATVKSLFEVHWASFEELISNARELNTSEGPRRGTDDLLEEVLVTVRNLQRQLDDFRLEVAGAGPVSRSEQKVAEAAGTALNYVKMMSPEIHETVSAQRLGQTLVLHLPEAVPEPPPEYVGAFQRLAVESGLDFRLQWADERWQEFSPRGRHTTGSGGALSFRE
jgi:hypothetical protein